MSDPKQAGWFGGGGLWENAALIAIGAFVAVGVYRWGAGRVLGFWNSHGWLSLFLITLVTTALSAWLFAVVWNSRLVKEAEAAITTEDEKSVYLGKTPEGEAIHLKQRYRTMHTQVIGTTSAGKTESVILPWAIRDLETGSGMIIIDGKSDKSFLEKFYAYAVKHGREKDFRLFSLGLPELSSTFNPLVGGTPYEVTERVFSAFEFDNPYYRDVQYKIFHTLVELIVERGSSPTFALVQRLLTDIDTLKTWTDHCEDEAIKHSLKKFQDLNESKRSENVSGLDAQLSHFTNGSLGALFNDPTPNIQLDQALRENRVCYFQLPSMYMPRLAAATGRLVLQSFQSAVSKRHLGHESNPGFFSCYLDDFQDYIYEGFGALLNKSRSANVGVVFSHQALGDLDKVSEAFRNVVLTNTNVKCVMRNNDPDTCEYFSRGFGTRTVEKVTERRTKDILGESFTGDGSVRETEEFKFHPNQIRGLGVGAGIVTIPHLTGVKTVRVQFPMRPDIGQIALPEVPKNQICGPEAFQPAKRIETVVNRAA